MSKLNSIDTILTLKAVNGLIDFEDKKAQAKNSLIQEYAKPILVQIQLKNEIAKPTVRPVRVKIPHTFFNVDGEDHSICFFCRSEDKIELEKYLASNPINGLAKLLSVNEIKKQYEQYKDKKQLLSEHTHFICDARVMRQLYNLLGKVFTAKNNHPIPVDYITSAKLADSIKKVTDSTYIHLKGRVINIRVGNTSMKVNNINENISSGIQYAMTKIPNGWKNIRCIHLKTPTSSALPVYSTEKEDVAGMAFIQEEGSLVSKKDATKKSSKIAAVAAATMTAAATVTVVADKKKKTKIDVVKPSSPASSSPAPAAVASIGKKSTKKEVPAVPAPVVEVVATPALASTRTSDRSRGIKASKSPVKSKAGKK